MRGRLCGALAAGLLALLLAGGCGEGATRFSGNEPPRAGGSGTLRYAVPAVPQSLDPLRAGTISERIVVSQLFEPLVARLRGPYGSARQRPGLALDWRHSRDFRVWSFRLRPGVSFQDGTPFNASAVKANAERWRDSSSGRRLLPGLVAADAPRPDLARLVLASPLRELPARLQDPRLGLVSPSAIAASGGLSRATQAGSGPFELTRRSSDRYSFARFGRWWGSRLGLGPALDGVDFDVVPSQVARLRVLRDTDVRVAAELDPGAARSLKGEPLLTAVGVRSGHAVGFERSVRGIDGWRPEPLSGVWLALIGPAG